MGNGTAVMNQESADLTERGSLVRVERGAPDTDEVAALVALLTVLKTRACVDTADSAGTARHWGRAWNDPGELLRHRRYPGSRK
jgi:hypothetical protein